MRMCAHALPCVKVFLVPRQRFSVDGKHFIRFGYRISVDGEHFVRFQIYRINVASTACGSSLLLNYYFVVLLLKCSARAMLRKTRNSGEDTRGNFEVACVPAQILCDALRIFSD